jgi:hypothetical protein
VSGRLACASLATSLLAVSGTPCLAAARLCGPLPPPSGDVVTVSSVAALQAAVAGAVPGQTILVADGIYALDGASLRLDVPGVTLRGESGNREAVVLDGNYLTTEIVQIAASGATLADLTLREAYDHPVHVTSTAAAATDDVLIYNVHVVDPGQQAIKVNPVPGGFFADHGTVACSRIELSAAGRGHVRDDCYTGGIDAHAARGWTVRDNVITGFWCAAGLSEHAVHFWRNSRDTVVERNTLHDNARGVGFGLLETAAPTRSYADTPCPAAAGGYVGHFDGSIRNNFVSAHDPALFASEYGFDCGICMWQACGAVALHNTVYTSNPGATFSAIEWRFAHTLVELTDNLVNAPLRERDGATATLVANSSAAVAAWFAQPASGDLRLTLNATPAIDAGAASAASDDIDADARPQGPAPDVGADETSPLDSAPPATLFHTVTPCRRVDTRVAGLGGPLPLAAPCEARFALAAGACGIPATAKAVSLNVAVTQPTAAGHVRLYPAGVPVPLVAALNYAAGQTRANNAVVALGSGGEIAVRVTQSSGSVHVVLDVNGYFE